MISAFRVKSFLLAILASLLFTAISFFVLNSFSSTQIISCTDGWAQNLIFALGFALVLQIFLAPKILLGHYRILIAAHAVLILLTLWLGLYSISPLGYSSGRIPVLHGFVVMTKQKGITAVPLGGVITLGNSAAAAVYPVTVPGDVRCTWMSVNAGALDDPHSCITAYIPPQADYDILKVSVQPGCGLPTSTGQFKIGILP